MNNRLKEIRNRTKKTQEEFGALIGASRGMVAKYEAGLVVPDNSKLELICIKFNVNRTWLETGEGEPYQESALIPELLRVVQKYPNLQAALERVLPLMDDDDWQALDRFLDKIEKKEL